MVVAVASVPRTTAVVAGARVLDPDARDRLAALAPRLTGGLLAGDRCIPVHPAYQGVLPQGLPCGATVLTEGQAALSSAFLLAAAPVQMGAWLGAAGLAAFGAQACAEAGVAPERVVVVRDTPSRTDEMWGQVLAALIDGFDVVLFGAAARVRAGTARRIQSRLQQRGAVLVIVGAAGPFSCDLTVASRAVWSGLGHGHGRLQTRQVHLEVTGRRMPRASRDTLWFPAGDGRIERLTPESGSTPLRRAV